MDYETFLFTIIVFYVQAKFIEVKERSKKSFWEYGNDNQPN